MNDDTNAWLREALQNPDFRNVYRNLDRMYAMIERIWHHKQERHWSNEHLAAVAGISVKTVNEFLSGWYTSSRTMHLGQLLLRVLGLADRPLPRSNRYGNRVKALRLTTKDRDVLSIPPHVLRGILQTLDNMAAGRVGEPVDFDDWPFR